MKFLTKTVSAIAVTLCGPTMSLCGADSQPNILFVIADDMGWADVHADARGPAHRALTAASRPGDWKLIVPRNELFNLADDPHEKRNLAKSEPARVADLLERLAQARKLDVAQRPTDPRPQE